MLRWSEVKLTLLLLFSFLSGLSPNHAVLSVLISCRWCSGLFSSFFSVFCMGRDRSKYCRSVDIKLLFHRGLHWLRGLNTEAVDDHYIHATVPRAALRCLIAAHW